MGGQVVRGDSLLDASLLWLTTQAAGAMGFRAVPLEPGTGGQRDDDGISDRQVEAAGKQRDVLAALSAIPEHFARALIAAHTPLLPSMRSRAGRVDAVDGSGCSLAAVSFWLCERELRDLARIIGSDRREGWLIELSVARKRVAGIARGEVPKDDVDLTIVKLAALRIVREGLRLYHDALTDIRRARSARRRRERERVLERLLRPPPAPTSVRPDVEKRPGLAGRWPLLPEVRR